MFTSKDILLKALDHKGGGALPVDFGSTAVTGIHCKIVEELRRHYGLKDKPVKIIDPFQMLGEVDAELMEIMGIDCVPVLGRMNVFGSSQTDFHEQMTPWGQKVLISEGIDLEQDAQGRVYIYPQGDRQISPCAMMPSGCYFIDAVERQKPVDDARLSYKDNMEEFALMGEEDIQYWIKTVDKAAATGKAVIASFGGAGLGDVAFIPGMALKDPKGIRSVAEWYMSTVLRPDYVHELFDHQTQIAIENYSRLWEAVGSKVDVVFTCGTDFGTQKSQFCSDEGFRDLWFPYYKRMNDWIHEHTTWKVFKHSCGSVFPLIPAFIDAGFDILNPVQINACNMDSRMLKKEFGDDIVFWGGGVDTQKVLAFGTPEDVYRQVIGQCEILGENGGFVFNTVHNIQANVPLENVVAMIDALNALRGR